jgi:rubrerythrin
MTTDKLIYLYCNECDILYITRIYPDVCPLCACRASLKIVEDNLQDAQITIFEISNKGD